MFTESQQRIIEVLFTCPNKYADPIKARALMTTGEDRQALGTLEVMGIVKKYETRIGTGLILTSEGFKAKNAM